MVGLFPHNLKEILEALSELPEFDPPVYFARVHHSMGARDSVVVEALCYKPEGHGFETR
jgi:hypothetical protein